MRSRFRNVGERRHRLGLVYERLMPGDPRVSPRTLEEHVARYRFAAQYVASKTVLDLACGSGYGSVELLKGGAVRVVGVDCSPEAIDHAVRNFSVESIQYVLGDALNYGLSGGTFDCIVSLETIEHLRDSEIFLRESTCVLRPDGMMILSTPNKAISSPHSNAPVNPYHVIEFELREFAKLLKRHFGCVEVWGQSPLATATAVAAAERASTLLPKSFRRLIMRNLPIARRYIASQAGSLTLNDVERCRNLVAVCSRPLLGKGVP